MDADDVLRVVLARLGGGMPVVEITTELAGVLLDISGRADFLTAESVIETVAGQSGYAQTENVKSIYDVTIDGIILIKKAYHEYLQYLADNESPMPGEPEYFALRHGKIYLWPVPDAVYSVTVDMAVYHPTTFTDVLFGAEFHEVIYEGVLAAVYAGQLSRMLAMAQRTLAETEEITFKFYEQFPDAKLHKERYEKEIEKLMGNVDSDICVVEYRDV
jgi:hypothetical protein